MCVIEIYFSYFSTKACVVGTQKNRDGSFEHPKHMFRFLGKIIITMLGSKVLLNWTFELLCIHNADRQV